MPSSSTSPTSRRSYAQHSACRALPACEELAGRRVVVGKEYTAAGVVALTTTVRHAAVEPVAAKTAGPFRRWSNDLGEEVLVGIDVARGSTAGERWLLL